MPKIVKKLWGEMHQSYFVIAWCVGVILGTILALVFRINYFSSVWWCVGAGVLLVIAYLKPKSVFAVVALLAGMVMVFFRVSGELAGESYVRETYGEEVMVSGVISGDPETEGNETKLKLVGLKFGEGCFMETGETFCQETAGSLYVTIWKNEELERGDTVKLVGEMSDGFGVYAGYMWKPKVVMHLKPEPGDLILRVRNWFAGRVRSLVPETEAQLGLSYLLGMKAGLSDEMAEQLRVVGLTHIVVASGAHLAILVEVAKKIFGKISRFAGVLFSGLFVVLFMMMIGWTPSIMRAGVMAILTLIAWQTGRKIEPWRLILMVMAGTLMVNPMFVLNMGWLLSFASYAGIMMVGPFLTKHFYGKKKPGFIASTMLTTISATIMTLPIVLYYYGQVSLVSAVANLLILPTLPWAMGAVFLVGLVAGIPGLEALVAWLATGLLDFHIGVVEFFGGMEQFLVKIPPYQVGVFVIYLVVLIPFATMWIRKKKRKDRYVV